MKLVGINWAVVGGDNTNVGGCQTGICRWRRHRCWWASTGLEPTLVGIDMAAEGGRGERGTEDGGEG